MKKMLKILIVVFIILSTISLAIFLYVSFRFDKDWPLKDYMLMCSGGLGLFNIILIIIAIIRFKQIR